MKRRWRGLAAGLALTGLIFGTVRGWTPLSSLLLVTPFIGCALVPSHLCDRAGRRWIALVILACIAGLPTLEGLPLAARYHAWPVWWAAVLHGWCALGIGGVALALAARSWRPGAGLARAGLAAGLMIAVAVLASPLIGLYVPHLTSSDAPRVLALSERTDLSLIMPDGTVLDARLYSPTKRRVLGIAVFTHGLGGWKEAWLNHLRLFLEADWAVLAYDLRGHGRSSPGAVTYGMREGDDLAEVWRTARTIADHRPMIAYGVSMGTSATMMAAQRLGDCRALILESPFADAAAMAELRLPAPLRIPALAVARWGVGLDLSALRPSAVAPPPDVQRLVGWIADDRVIPPAQSRELARALGAETVIQEHGEHLDLIVHEPWRERVRLLLRTVAKDPASL